MFPESNDPKVKEHNEHKSREVGLEIPTLLRFQGAKLGLYREMVLKGLVPMDLNKFAGNYIF